MHRFRHVTRLLVGVLVFWLLFGGAGCSEAEPEMQPDDVVMSQVAYEQLLDAAPDSVLDNALDSLFLDHDLAAFAPVTYDSAAALRWVDSVMASLTLDEKIGQLFIVHLPARAGVRRVVNDEALKAVRDHSVGGFLVPRTMKPRDVYAETQRLQQAANVPLFFAADYERGVGRFNNALTELPSNMALGATRDTVLAAAAGRLTALESRAIGVNLLFAPVVDVNNNPANPIINIRSYGEEAGLVSQMAAAFVHEAERYGVMTTLKHFPGHGNTSVDSHARMGMVRGDAAALDSIELRPYREVLRGTYPPAGVMTAHLWVRAIDDQPLPATFSPNLLRTLLRDSLGFKGFIVTDDIKMGALQNTYDVQERIVRPLQAGADIILTPASLPRAIDAVKAALRRGTLSQADIDASVRHVLVAKAHAGLHVARFSSEATLDYLLEKPRGAYIAQTIADRAVTLLKANNTLPLQAGGSTALVQMSNTRWSESIGKAMDFFKEMLVPATDVRPGTRPSTSDINTALQAVADAEVVVLALYLRLQSGRGEAGLFEQQDRLVYRLLAQGKPVVLVTFGNPYAVIPFSEADVLVVAYEQSLESVATVAGILQGLQPARGTLPITVDSYAYGSGLVE